jgi:ABC-type amino acid transport substrate-binding protein
LSIRERKNRFRFLANKESVQKIDIKQMIRFGVVVGVIVAVILISVSLILQGNIESSYLAKAEIIRVGVRTDVQGFGQTGETGEIQGYDVDVAREVLNRVLGKDKPLEFIPLNSEEAGAGIKYGKIDMGLGFLAEGTARVNGFMLSAPYYYDNIYAVVTDQGLSSLKDLNEKNVGILNSMITQAQANDYLDKLQISAKVARYFSLEDAAADMQNKKIDAFLAPEALLRQYMGQYNRIDKPVATIGYSIILPSKQEAVEGAMDAAIHAMERDGTLQSLAKKWGIPYNK